MDEVWSTFGQPSNESDQATQRSCGCFVWHMLWERTSRGFGLQPYCRCGICEANRIREMKIYDNGATSSESYTS